MKRFVERWTTRSGCAFQGHFKAPDSEKAIRFVVDHIRKWDEVAQDGNKIMMIQLRELRWYGESKNIPIKEFGVQ